MCNKNIFIKKYGFTGLVFQLDTIDGKKWVKFVVMQQNSATLIYDTMKGTVESYLTKVAPPLQTVQFQA